MSGSGELLREWRQRRHLSQLDLAVEAGVSSRHLSFIETGRSRPSSEMLLRLAEFLDIPLRERNRLLLAGGFAPAYPERDLADPDLAAVRQALKGVLAGHEPYPAVVINRWWELLDANAAISLFTTDVAPHLLAPPVNALRLSLHPEGMAPRITNLAQWRGHLLIRLRRQAQATGDQKLAALHDELAAYPGGISHPSAAANVVVPLRYRTDDNELSFLSITTVLGTPMDITVEELAIEAFYPADDKTASALRSRHPQPLPIAHPHSGPFHVPTASLSPQVVGSRGLRAMSGGRMHSRSKNPRLAKLPRDPKARGSTRFPSRTISHHSRSYSPARRLPIGLRRGGSTATANGGYRIASAEIGQVKQASRNWINATSSQWSGAHHGAFGYSGALGVVKRPKTLLQAETLHAAAA